MAFIGWFLPQAVEPSHAQLIIRDSIASVCIRDVMRDDVAAVPAGTGVQEAVEGFFFQHDATMFPVVREGEFVGLLTIEAVRGLEHEQWASIPVASVAHALDLDLVLSPDDEGEEAVKRLGTKGEALLVVIHDGRLEGTVSHAGLYRHMHLHMGPRGGSEGSARL